MTWATLALLPGSCVHPVPPVPRGRYNDTWKGELRLPDRILKLELGLHVTRADETAAREEPYTKQVLAHLQLARLGSLAATGDVSCYSAMDLDRTVQAPRPGREFIALRLSPLTGLVNTEAHPRAASRYEEVHEALLKKIRPGIEQGTTGEVLLVGERVFADVLQGIVVLRLSRRGSCRAYRQGRCTQWSVVSRKERVGHFVLERRGPAPPGSHLGQSEVRGGPFVLTRRQEGPGSVSWTLRFAEPPDAGPPPSPGP